MEGINLKPNTPEPQYQTIKPGMKVDLSKIDPVGERRRKNHREQKRSDKEIPAALQEGLAHSIPLINEKSRLFGGPPELVDQQGQIKMESYAHIYGAAKVAQDIRTKTIEKEGHQSGYSRQALEMRDGITSEATLFLLLNKLAGDNYMVVRSSDFDDFENGTDLLLVDTRSGKTICAFDETVEDVKSRLSKKTERARNNLQQGYGTRVKYGMKFTHDHNNNPRMELGAVRDIPPLFLALERDHLKKMLHNMDFYIDSPLSDIEKEALQNMTQKLRVQIEDFKTITDKISFDAAEQFIAYLEEQSS